MYRIFFAVKRPGCPPIPQTLDIGMTLKSYFVPLSIGIIILGSMAACAERSIQPPKGRNADQLYNEGLSQFNKENYRQAIETFYQLKYNYPAEAAAMMAELKIADAYYADEKYVEAIESYEDFRKMHPASSYIPYAIYMIGLCYHKQMMSVDRDQTNTRRALAEFQYLLTHFPNTPYVYDAYEKAEECMKRLSEHEVYVGNFYYKSKEYEAAVQRYETALKRYAAVPLEAEVLFRLANAYRRIDRPEKAKKTYLVIIEQYPDSKFAEKSQDRLEEVPQASTSPQGDMISPSAESITGADSQIDTVASVESPVLPAHPPAGSAPSPFSVNRPDLNGSTTAPVQPPEEAHPDFDIEPVSSENGNPVNLQPRPQSMKVVAAVHNVADPDLALVSADPSGEMSTAKMQSAANPESILVAGFPIAARSSPGSDRPVATEWIEETSNSPVTYQNDLETSFSRGPSSFEKASTVLAERELGSEPDENPVEASTRSGTEESKTSLGFGELSSDRPINITADRMDAFQMEDRVVFEGNVVVRQENTFIYAQHITAEMAPDDQGGGIRRVVALQDVRITENNRMATCNRAEFDNITRVIELSGNPKVWRGKDRIYGDKVVVDLDSNKMTVVGSSEKRVSAVLYPKSEEKEKKKPQTDSDTSRPSLTVPFAGPENVDLNDSNMKNPRIDDMDSGQ